MNRSEIEMLERQGCFSDDWNKVKISEKTDLRRIRNVYFRGNVSVGAGTEIINVPGGLCDVRIGDHVRIVNVARIESHAGAVFGIGTEVAVLDETGSRPVKIYPGISSQTAAVAVLMPEYASCTLRHLIDRHIEELPDMLEIGDRSEIIDCGPIQDVRIWPNVKVEGAAWLKNGSIVNNVDGRSGLTYVGQGVNAENFIIEDAEVANGVILRNTYVGQGCVIDKGFTAHDSLFFANCSMENGEACAVFAGPYTVSMHKSSLLIGVQTSFMNAGSGTNMSNHMYKLGPMHWGVLERGVKTSSNSYLMHGSRIGAFSLVMGEHKTHPDTSDFPFSYVFGDAKGHSTLVPGAMLKSYGLKRDSEKWPKRDRRDIPGLRKTDRINFHTFNPNTMSMTMKAIKVIDRILSESDPTSDYVTYKGLKISRRSLEKGRKLYSLAISKYIQQHTGNTAQNNNSPGNGQKWIDLGGAVISESQLNKALDATSLNELENNLDRAMSCIDQIESYWIKEQMKDMSIHKEDAMKGAVEFDTIVDNDRMASLDQVSGEAARFGHL
ncbi:MAG: DUF4954 family protein [Muribaculaceae bacterium]|nr:DUF4954 family protein [Muribaculaceae bacterium]